MIRVSANENAHALGAERIEDRAHFLRIELKLVSVSREALLGLHRDGKVDDGVLHRIESELDLDLEELRLLRLLEPSRLRAGRVTFEASIHGIPIDARSATRSTRRT